MEVGVGEGERLPPDSNQDRMGAVKQKIRPLFQTNLDHVIELTPPQL